MSLSGREQGAPLRHIAICGSGLAARCTAAALANRLPSSIQITLVELRDQGASDLFYGNVTGPSAYEFNRSTGVPEPALVLNSDAAFSWGTKFDRWASGQRSWVQCHHLPLPIIDGVLFHHYLAQQGIEQLEPFLLPAVAARRGAFAHPPDQVANPASGPEYLFSRAEYGYLFDPETYSALFTSGLNPARVRRLEAERLEVELGPQGIAGLRLSSDQRLEADLYVDCTGPRRRLLSALGVPFSGSRQLRAASSESQAASLGPPLRSVTAADHGWTAVTPLKGRLCRLAVYDASAALSDPDGEPNSTAEATLGRTREAWSQNCVAIGHAAGVIEPLTPAPMMLLERDIDRLISLIPVSSEVSVERREFNRRSEEDFEHAELFTRALFETDGLPETDYWREAKAAPVGEKLARKIALFEDRGLLVAYDLEPFNNEDWTILHCGMGRRPRRHDRSADRAPPERVRQFLSSMKESLEKIVAKLPDHATYRTGLERYLVQKENQHATDA